jgi:hypothetical protein
MTVVAISRRMLGFFFMDTPSERFQAGDTASCGLRASDGILILPICCLIL